MDTSMRWIVVIPAPAPARAASRMITAGLLGIVTGSMNHAILEAGEVVQLSEKIRVPEACNLCGADSGTKHRSVRREVTFSEVGAMLGGPLLGKATVEFRVPLCDRCAKLPAAPGVALEGYGKRGDLWEVTLRVGNGAVAALYAQANPGATLMETAPATAPAPAASPWRTTRVVQVPGGWAVVADGIAGKTYDAILKDAVFHNGRRIAYAAKAGGKWVVVVDEAEGKPYDGILNLAPLVMFSPDGSRTAYGALVGPTAVVVVDGTEFTACAGLAPGSLTFSPDSRRFGYIAKTGTKWNLVVDGSQGPAWDGFLTTSLTFSPDGTRLAVGALANGRWGVAADGVPWRPYAGILDLKPTITFSADGRRVGYAAKLDGGTVTVVIDGLEQGPCLAIKAGSLAFSPDGEQVSYQARMRGRPATEWTTVVARAPSAPPVPA